MSRGAPRDSSDPGPTACGGATRREAVVVEVRTATGTTTLGVGGAQAQCRLGTTTTAVPGQVGSPLWLITSMSRNTQCSPLSVFLSVTLPMTVSTSCFWLMA